VLWGDGDLGPLKFPEGVAVDRRGRVLVAEPCKNRLRVLAPAADL
jgi:hypothetical protein